MDFWRGPADCGDDGIDTVDVDHQPTLKGLKVVSDHHNGEGVNVVTTPR